MAKRARTPAAKDSSPRRIPAASGSAEPAFERVAAALERLAPPARAAPQFGATDAFSWHPDERRLQPVAKVNRVEMSLLKGIDRMRDVLVENTERFARGL